MGSLRPFYGDKKSNFYENKIKKAEAKIKKQEKIIEACNNELSKNKIKK